MQLLQHFKELTIRPKNAKELKGLILQLAIQGKLTSNWRAENPNIEPASELLNRIQREKAKLIKDKKIRKSKSLPIIKKDEFPFKIPNKWTWCRLQDYLDVRDGTHDSPKYIDDGIPLVTSKNLYTKKLDISNVKYISEEDHIEISKRSNVERNDILFAMIGSIGNPVIVDIEPNFSIKNVALIKYYLKDVCLPKFVLFFLEYATKEFKDNSDGAVQSFVSLTKLRAKEFPLPPLEEQKKIVKVVETLFEEVEQLEQLTVERIDLKEDFVNSALKQLTANNTKKEWGLLQEYFKTFFNETINIKKLRETVLQLAVQGKLTADWRSINPNVDSVSQSIEEAFKNQKIITSGRRKFLKPVNNVIFNDTRTPVNWVKSQFFNLCVLKRGHDLPKQNRVIGKYAVASSGGISGWHNEYKSERGVVIGRSGSTGKPHLIEDKHWPLNTVLYGEDYCGNYIDYVYVFLQAFDFSQYSSSTAVPTLNRNKFLNELITIPPIEEQKVIVQKVNALMGLCDVLEQEVKQAQEHSELLMQSCLREVFTPKEIKDELINSLLPELDSLQKVANLQQAMIVQKTEIGLGSGRGKVYLQKTSANLKSIKKVAIGYTFEKSHHGEFSWQLSEDLDKNPYLQKVTTNYGEIYKVKPNEQHAVLKALNSPDNHSFVQSIDELIEVYKNKLINGSTDRVELLNTVCKAITDTQSTIGNTVYAYMQGWEIKQNDFKSKADKFTESETFAMIQLVTQLEWDKELVSQ